MIVIDTVPEPVPHRLVRLTGAVRHWTCQSQHQVVVRGLPFPVQRQRFIAWLPLAPGWQEVTLSADCGRCQLHSQRTLRLLCRPAGGPCRVQPTLLVCAGEDGSVPAPNGEDSSRAGATRRLWVGCLLLQALLADKLREQFPGRPTRTFALCDTVLTQRLQLTRHEALRMEPRQLWSRIATELQGTSIDLATTKVLGFLACTALGGGSAGHVWQGGGGLALGSAACLFSWPRSVAEIGPRFKDERAAPAGADTSGRGTRWACLSTTLGAAAHELCHALDLGHAAHGLMGRAYDELWRYCVLETGGGGVGGIRRPPPGLPAVPGVPAGHRCDANCHAQAVPCPQTTSDLTFLDAASAAVLYHHAWCGAGQSDDGAVTDAAVQISPALEAVSPRPLRVVVCRTADAEARLVGLRTLDGKDCRLELGPWVSDIVAKFRSVNSVDDTGKIGLTSQGEISEEMRGTFADQQRNVGKDKLHGSESLEDLRHTSLAGEEKPVSFDLCLTGAVDEFLVLVENDIGGIAKRTCRL